MGNLSYPLKAQEHCGRGGRKKCYEAGKECCLVGTRYLTPAVAVCTRPAGLGPSLMEQELIRTQPSQRSYKLLKVAWGVIKMYCSL